jgi:hypothetical protein
VSSCILSGVSGVRIALFAFYVLLLLLTLFAIRPPSPPVCRVFSGAPSSAPPHPPSFSPQSLVLLSLSGPPGRPLPAAPSVRAERCPSHMHAPCSHASCIMAA